MKVQMPGMTGGVRASSGTGVVNVVNFADFVDSGGRPVQVSSGTGVVNVVNFADFVDSGGHQARASSMSSTLQTL